MKSISKALNKPASAFVNKLSTWSGIFTGIASLVVSFVALKISIEQQHDRSQLKKMTEMITKLDQQIKATDKLTKTNLYQNGQIDNQLSLAAIQSKETQKQVKFIANLFDIMSFDNLTKRNKDNMNLNDGLISIERSMFFLEVFSQSISSEDTIREDGIQYVRNIDSLAKALIKEMEVHRFNPKILNNSKKLSAWVDYMNATYNFRYSYCTTIFPRSERRKCLLKYNSDSIKFMNVFYNEYPYFSTIKIFMRQLQDKIDTENRMREFNANRTFN